MPVGERAPLLPCGRPTLGAIGRATERSGATTRRRPALGPIDGEGLLPPLGERPFPSTAPSTDGRRRIERALSEPGNAGRVRERPLPVKARREPAAWPRARRGVPFLC